MFENWGRHRLSPTRQFCKDSWSLMNSGYQFIVADDDPRARFLIEFALRRTFGDATVLSFEDAVLALNCFNTAGADAVITDFNMPTLNGAELTRLLRDSGSSIPVIMVSNSPDGEAEGRAAGISHYLDKGDVMEHLTPVLSELLNTRSGPTRKAAVV